MAAAGVARAAQLVLAILLARRFGASQYGVFTFALGAATLASFCASLGWPDLFNRLYPAYLKDRAWGRLRGLNRFSDLLVAGFGLAAALFLVALGGWSGDLRQGLFFAAAMTVPLALVILRRQQLAGIRHAATGLLFDQGFAALITVAAVACFSLMDLTPVVLTFCLASVLSVLITTVLFRRRLPPQVRDAAPEFEGAAWFKMALPMTAGNLARQVLNRVDVIMLAPLASIYDVGLYGAAWRLTYLLSFPQVVLMTIIGPLLSEAYVHHDLERIRKLMRLASLYVWVTTLPTIAVFLIAPSAVMRLVFGAKFTEAGTTLVLLGLAQFVAAFTNANASLLMMGGRERVYGAINVMALAASLTLNLALIPLYGRNGAAAVTLATSCLLFALQYHHSRKLQNSLGEAPKQAPGPSS
jgi:O-antigen/teichoic acid export membrane protein